MPFAASQRSVFASEGARSPLTILSVAYPFAAVSPDAVGGAEQVLSTLDAALVRAGHRSVVVAAQGSRVAGTLVSVPRATGVIDERAKAQAWERRRRAIAAALARWPIDLVHTHGVDFYEYLPANVPTLVTLHLPLSWYPDQAWRQRPDLWFTCVSRAQAREMDTRVNMLPPVENGVPVEAFAARHAKRGFALMLARICPEKGIHIGLDAARRAGVPLLVGGSLYRYPEHESYFETEVKPRLDARRRLVGALDFRRKRRLMTAARCVLIPSLAPETSSLVAMEAAACGTPVIAFASGALPDIVEHGRTGFIVGDVDEMAAAIGKTDCIDPAVCREVARRRFSATTTAERYLMLYRELTAGPASTSPLRAAS
jgi:glycosyltransferase involved in cell wall biosynthesis